jgi:hypothetical protein
MSITDLLNKSTTNKSFTVYRAIKVDKQTKIQDILNTEKEIISTSYSMDTSFAKYDDYNIILKYNVAKGVRAIDISPFSDYGSTENEVLIYIDDDHSIIVNKIENHTKKTVVKCEIINKKGDKEI